MWHQPKKVAVHLNSCQACLHVFPGSGIKPSSKAFPRWQLPRYAGLEFGARAEVPFFAREWNMSHMLFSLFFFRYSLLFLPHLIPTYFDHNAMRMASFFLTTSIYKTKKNNGRRPPGSFSISYDPANHIQPLIRVKCSPFFVYTALAMRSRHAKKTIRGAVCDVAIWVFVVSLLATGGHLAANAVTQMTLWDTLGAKRKLPFRRNKIQCYALLGSRNVDTTRSVNPCHTTRIAGQTPKDPENNFDC